MSFLRTTRWPVRLAMIIIVFLATVALTSQWWLPYDPQAINLPARLLSPDSQHWLGTDHLGRDIFSRLNSIHVVLLLHLSYRFAVPPQETHSAESVIGVFVRALGQSSWRQEKQWLKDEGHSPCSPTCLQHFRLSV